MYIYMHLYRKSMRKKERRGRAEGGVKRVGQGENGKKEKKR